MPTHPKITVLTPSLNQGRFLETCIRSILDQGYPNLEYLLVDGGSRDESLEVIQRYREHFAWWVSEPDAGQADAINKGLTRATGDLVAWLNADDFYYPGALQAVAQAYQANPDASFFYGDGQRVDENGNVLARFFPKGVPGFNLSAMIHGLNYILQPAAFINRASLERVGHLDPQLHWGLDTDLWIRLSGLSAPQPVNAVLAASREYGETKTSTGSFRRIEELRKLAEKHGGLPITPGVLCYQLDTLHRFAVDHPDIYPADYVAEIDRFWLQTSRLLAHYQARPDGIPMQPEEMTAARDDSRPGLVERLLRKINRSLGKR